MMFINVFGPFGRQYLRGDVIMFMELLSNMANFSAREMKQAHPEKYQNFVEAVINLTEISVELIRQSPEFREAFARVHNEFLKYPESKATIKEAMGAYSIYASDTTLD